ncbi:MAG: protein kinase [Myxococcales bacterium]|nr:protein kinase [Myxococcales bacterium]
MSLGPFELKEPVGRGGTGVVYRGVHATTGLDVAVKVFHRAVQRSRSAPETFRNEVRAVASLTHPGIVWVFDAGTVDEQAAEDSGGALVKGNPYLAMELASGGTLATWSPPSYDEVHALLEELLSALAHAHARNVVHRDLKPGNVLLCTHHDVRPGWKLTDFGIAANFEQTQEKSLSTGIVGTLSYMSPEQISGSWRWFGPWTDLYSLGCVLYRVLGGVRPWANVRGAALLTAHLERQPEPLRSGVPLPAGFDGWLATLLQKRPQERFPTAFDALEALRALGPPGHVPPPREDPETSGGSWPPPRLVGAGLGLMPFRTPPLVGRQVERRLLWRLLSEAIEEGRSKVVLIRGPTGVGKTRLAKWVAEVGHERLGLPFLLGEARRGEAPSVALSRPLRRWLRIDRLSSDDRTHLLRQRFPGAEAPWLEELGSTLAAEEEGDEITGEGARLVISEALARIGTPKGGCVLVLDDAHASPDVLSFCQMLARSARRGVAIVAVVALSDEGLSEDQAASDLARELEELAVGTVVLGPLQRDDHSRMVSAMLPMDATLAAQLGERTGFNPMHSVQVLQDWARSGALSRSAAGYVLEGPTPNVPPMDDVWQRRLQAVVGDLPHAAQGLLECAATLGSQVDEGEWQRVTDDPQAVFGAKGQVVLLPENARMRSVLRGRLLAARLVEETASGWAFVHEMFREFVLEVARAEGRLARHHRACARMLLHTKGSHRFAERIGRHLLAGHRPESAIPQLRLGIHRRRQQAGEAAALPLLALLKSALEQAKVPASERPWCELAVLRGDVLVRLGRLDQARQEAIRAMQIAESTGATELGVRATWILARVLVAEGDPAAADSHLADAEDRMAGIEDPGLLGQIHAARSRCARERGELGPSRGHAVMAAQALAAAGADARVAEAWQVLGEDALADGRLDDAERFASHAWRRQHQSPVGQAVSERLLGQVALARGDLEAARRRLRHAADTLRRLGNAQADQAMLALAQVHLAREAWADAQTVATSLMRLRGFEPYAPSHVAAHCVLAAACAGAGDWVAFDAHLERVDHAKLRVRTYKPEIEATLGLAAQRSRAAGEPARAAKAHTLAAAFGRNAVEW